MSSTEQQTTPGERSGRGKTVPAITPTNGGPTPQVEQIGLQKSTPAEISTTLPESSDGLQSNFERAALDSMTLLQKSGNKLMALLDACVPSDDMDRGKDGGMKVEAHRLETAVSIANAMATTVQTQVNMVKALGALWTGKG